MIVIIKPTNYQPYTSPRITDCIDETD